MQLPAFLSITSDLGFKATFGNPRNTLFLRRALQALIKSEVPIREVTLDRNAFEGLTAESRSGIYDLSCVDELGRHFIVEMQVAHSPHFLQRLKFYAFHRLDTLVQRGGKENWDNLPPIYCIALLSKGMLKGPDYHTVVNLRSETGELVDSQLTFILAELDKFSRPETEIHTDLDKLLYTMQVLETPPLDIDLEKYPPFWDEEWLKVALEELRTRNLTPEQHEQFARAIAKQAEGLYQERERERLAQKAERLAQETERLAQETERLEQETERLEQETGRLAQERDGLAQERDGLAHETERLAQEVAAARAAQQNTIRKLLRHGKLSPEEIAELTGATPAEVQRLQVDN